jgi:hypothetical protein
MRPYQPRQIVCEVCGRSCNAAQKGALPHGKSFFVHFKHLFSSGSELAFPPRPQRRSSALEW